MKRKVMLPVFIVLLSCVVLAEDKPFDVSLYGLAMLHTADLFSTHRFMTMGYTEVNPIFKNSSIGTMAAAKILGGILHVYLLKWIYKKNKTVGWVVSIATNMALGYIVYHNLSLGK